MPPAVGVLDIARWNGASWNQIADPVNYGLGPTSPSVAAEYRGRLFVGNSDGLSVWNGVGWRWILEGPVYALSVHQDELWVAGGFLKAGNVRSPFLIRWHGCPLCPADLNDDRFVDDLDFQMFVGAYNVLDCAAQVMPAGCLSDINNDRLVDDIDFQAFVVAYGELVCAP